MDKDLLLQQLEQANERSQQLEAELGQVQQKTAVLLGEERQRCDALAADNENICRLLEEQRTQIAELGEKEHLRGEEARSASTQLEKNETALLLQIHQLKEDLAAKEREVRFSKESMDVHLFF